MEGITETGPPPPSQKTKTKTKTHRHTEQDNKVQAKMLMLSVNLSLLQEHAQEAHHFCFIFFAREPTLTPLTALNVSVNCAP